MTPVEKLKDAIRKLHGGRISPFSVPVKELFNGETVWDGVVEVFAVHGHPKANTAYARLHNTGDPKKPFRPVAILRIHPALSPVDAVRALIVQEFRANASSDA